MFHDARLAERLWQGGYRLGGRCFLSRDVALWNGNLLDGPYRLSGAPIKHKGQTLLGDLRHSGDVLPLHRDIH